MSLLQKHIFAISISFFFTLPSSFASEPFTVVAGNYPPFYGKSLPNQGWMWQLVKAALQSQGFKPKVLFFPWARALDETKSGNYDALMGAYWTKERTQWFVYSLPLAEVRTGFFKLAERKEITFNGELEQLKKWVIGVGRGYAYSKAFDKADYLMKVKLVDTSHGLEMLYNRRIDLLTGNNIVDTYFMKNKLESKYKGISKEVIFIEPALKVNELHLAVSKKTPNHLEKLRDFNRGMKQLLLDGTYNNILNKQKDSTQKNE